LELVKKIYGEIAEAGVN